MVVPERCVDLEEDIVIAEFWYLDSLVETEAVMTTLAVYGPLLCYNAHLLLLVLSECGLQWSLRDL